MLPASSAGGACEAWELLGVYKPMLWSAKQYRTFRQIPTFTRVLCCPLFKNLPQILPLGVFFGVVNYYTLSFANTSVPRCFFPEVSEYSFSAGTRRVTPLDYRGKAFWRKLVAQLFHIQIFCGSGAVYSSTYTTLMIVCGPCDMILPPRPTWDATSLRGCCTCNR